MQRQCSSLSQSKRDLGATSDIAYDQCSMTILEEENKVTAAASQAAVSSTSAAGQTAQLSPSSTLNSSSTLTASASTAASVVAHSGSPQTSEVVTSLAASAGKNQYLSTMISNVADRYITPEYLAPLPPTEKTGKSPLQLLAQTCSQIGADPGSNKITLDNKTKDKNKAGSPALIVSDNTSPNTALTGTTQVNHHRPFSFKPYETADSLSSSRKKANKTPSSVISLSPSSNNNTTEISSRSPPKSSSSTLSTSTTLSSSSSSSSEATPVIRSGMEVLAGHPKDLQSLGLYANPAFRPPLAASGYPASLVPPTSLAASLAAAAAGSLGGGNTAAGGGVCRDPYCRDQTCPTAVYNAQLMASLMASGLPPGYAELLQAHKTSAVAAANGAGPYICNWMNGREGYCGKRHSSAEELLQHLRTHTNLSTSDSAMYSASAAAAANFQRTYGSAMSSMSAAASRFHPYAAAVAAATAAKSSALPPSLSALGAGLPPPLPTGLPPSLYSPAAASSLYASLYGSRLAGSLP